MNKQTGELDYVVAGMSCAHCERAVAEEVVRVAGVTGVEIDLASGRLTVAGEAVSDAEVRAAVDRAGYEVAA